MQSSQHFRTTMFIIILSAFGGMLYGYDLGIISGAFLFVHDSIHMTDLELELIVGSVFFGGALATLVTGPLCELFGRKPLLILSGIVFITGVALVVFAHNYPLLLGGRLVQGIGVGILTIAIPLYIAESVPAEVRGRAICGFCVALTFGILLASAVGLAFTPSHDWRGMFASALIPGIIYAIGTLFLPESPRWLCREEYDEKALAVLKKTMSFEKAQAQLNEIKHSFDSIHDPKTRESIWHHQYIIPLVLVFSIAILHQLTGINSILQLGGVIFKASGLGSNVMAMIGTTVITGINFITTLIALMLIDKLGRRSLLLFGVGGIVLSLFFSGLVSLLMVASTLKGILLLIAILAFIISYAIGPGVIIWLILSELLPSRVRSTGMAIGLFLNSMTSSLLATFFLEIVRYVNYAGVFWFCAVCSALYFIIVWRFVPEAKGQSLEAIEHKFE